MTKVGWATLLAVAIPIAVLFGPVLFSDRSFAMRDAAHFYHPLFEWCCREWGAGRVPLWNPYENCGLPVLADASSSIFYPGKLVFLLPVDFNLRYKLYVIGHVVLAAGGSYCLARRWKATPYAAAIAAIAYACGGNVVFQYCNAVFLVGAAWLPLAALAADRMLRGRSWPAAVLLGVVLAMMILGGDPQAAYHGLLITGLYALILGCAKDSTAAPSWTTRLRGLAMLLGLTGAAAVVGFGLAAVQILPSSEATQFSERAAFDRPRNIYEATSVALNPASDLPYDKTRAAAIVKGLACKVPEGTHHDLAFDFSVGPWRLTEYLWPNIGGRMLPTNRRWFSLLPFEGRVWTPTLYMGLLPVLLGLACLRLRGGEPRQRWLTWLVLIFTLASFGMYGLGWVIIESYALLKQAHLVGGDPTKIDLAPGFGGVYWFFVTFLPTYIYFRYPAKLLPLVSLGLSQLAASGWDRTFAHPRPWLSRVLLVLGYGSAAAAMLVWFLQTGLFPSKLPGDSSLGPFDRSGAYYDVLTALVQAAIVSLGMHWSLKQAWREPAQSQRWQLALLIFTAVEIAVANYWLVMSAPGSIWRDESAIAATIKSATADSVLPPRVFRAGLGNWRPPSFKQKSSQGRVAELTRWEQGTLFPKYHLPSGLSLVESYGSIKLLDYESLLFVARSNRPKEPDGSTLPQPTPLRLLGTEYLVLPQSHAPKYADRVPAESAKDWPESAALWRMQRPLPRAWIVHDITVLPPLARPLRIAAVDRRSAEVLYPNRKARDFTHSAVVETAEPQAEWSTAPAATPLTAAEPCRITHFDPQRLTVEAKLAQPGLLVLGEAWFPGWQATVTTGGKSHAAPVYRTNRVLRGVWLPAGKHQVEFRFQPASFYRGAWLSGVSWLLVAIVGVVTLRRSSLSPAA